MDEKKAQGFDPEKIDAKTVTRTVVLALTIVNTILAISGKDKIPFTENGIYEAVTAILTVIVPLWNWWENNAFTKSARKAEAYRKDLKREEKANDSKAKD